jgi:hypothetical protein
MRFLPVTILLLLIPIVQTFGHEPAKDSLAKPPKYDTAYIHDYKSLLTARVFGLIQDTRLVYNQDQSGDIVFKPNLPYKLGIAGFYKWFGLGLSIYSPFFVHDEGKNGKSEGFDLRVNLYSNVFAIEGLLQRYKGFYISNFDGMDGDHFTNPEMTIYSIGAIGYYFYNFRRFSFRSAYIQNEWQKKSAGSFMVRGGVNVSTLDAPGGMIPQDFIDMYGYDSLTNLSKGTLVSATLAPGYGYNLVFLKRCYLHAAVFAGPAYNYYQDKTEGTGSTRNVYSMLLFFRGAMGYTGKKFHAGFSAVLYGLQPVASETYNLYLDPPQFRIWVGTRFNLFKKKNKKM